MSTIAKKKITKRTTATKPARCSQRVEDAINRDSESGRPLSSQAVLGKLFIAAFAGEAMDPVLVRSALIDAHDVFYTLGIENWDHVHAIGARRRHSVGASLLALQRLVRGRK